MADIEIIKNVSGLEPGPHSIRDQVFLRGKTAKALEEPTARFVQAGLLSLLFVPAAPGQSPISSACSRNLDSSKMERRGEAASAFIARGKAR